MHSRRPVRRRPHSGWVLARRIVQYLALVGFLAVAIGSGRGGWAGTLSTSGPAAIRVYCPSAPDTLTPGV